MRYWDSSALVALCVLQDATGRAESLYAQDPDVVVWWGTPVECASALGRLRRAGSLGLEDADRAWTALERLADGWSELQPASALRHQALRLLRVHPLTAADALQLAAAIEWIGTPSAGEIVTFDEGLATASRLEGFRVPSPA